MTKDTPKVKGAKLNRLRRIEGQVRGVAQMVEDDRYCMDILHQIAAIKSALAKVETQVLKDHAACCVVPFRLLQAHIPTKPSLQKKDSKGGGNETQSNRGALLKESYCSF